MAFVDDTTGGRVIMEGICPVKVTLDLPSTYTKVFPGDPLGFKETGWECADTDGSSGVPVYAELVAGEAGEDADVITAYREAKIDFGSGCTATLDDELFISSTVGSYTVSSGSRGQPIGFMLDAQVGYVAPQYHMFPRHISITMDNTSGDSSGFEVRCQRDASAGEVKGADFSARLGDTYTATAIAGLKAAVNVKGTSAGTISSRVCCVHAELESGSGGTRTFSGPVCSMYAKNNMGTGTYTKKVVVIHADTPGGGKAWDGFLSVQATGDAGVVVSNDGMTDSPQTNAEAGYLKVYVDTTEYQIPLYAA